MATLLNTANYDLLNTQIQEILKTGKTALITIYSDAEATTIVSDSVGPIQARQASSVSYTQSYLDADGNPTNPFLEIKFLDGSSFTELLSDVFKTVDNEAEFWYVLTTGNIPMMAF
jgi:hypothetical protein